LLSGIAIELLVTFTSKEDRGKKIPSWERKTIVEKDIELEYDR
jgi:hypothetical protein